MAETTRWQIEVQFGDRWIVLDCGFSEKNQALWAIGTWKQTNQCYGDPFRAVPMTADALAEVK